MRPVFKFQLVPSFLGAFLFLTFASSNAKAESPVYTFSTTFQGAQIYHGNIFDANANIKLSNKVHLIPGVRRLERNYGEINFGETTGYLGLTHTFGKGFLGGGFYAVHEINVTPDAIINPEAQGLSQLHYAHGREDFGINVGFSKYYNLRSGSIGPNYYHAFNGIFAMSSGMNFVKADRWLSAGQIQAILTPNSRTDIRSIYASGETLEAAGLQARFSSVTLEAMFAVAKRVRVGLGVTGYKSNLRKEDSALLRLEVR